VPDTPFVPVQPSDALQLVAFATDHVSVEFPPEATLDGLADIEMMGTGVPLETVTVTFRVTLPPEPEHDSV